MNSENKKDSKKNRLNIDRENYYLGYNRLLNGDLRYAINLKSGKKK